MQLRRSTLLLLCGLSVLAAVCASCLSVTAQSTPGSIRIPLKRLTVDPDAHPTRSAMALSKQLAATANLHHSVNLATDPSRPVSLKNYFDRMYTGVVSIGTPAVDYSLVFDTGSADLWVFSASTTASTKESYVTYYDASASSTAVTTSTPWSITYGKGSASGVLAKDTAGLAGLRASSVTFATATTWSDDFETQSMPLDGLLGLAFQSVSSAGAPTLLDELKNQGLISERIFSFYLTSNSADGSEFVLGAPDLTYTAGGNLTYLSLASSSGMWLLSMQQVTLGSTVTSFCADTSAGACAVLIDTGTSFVGMPSSSYSTFVRSVVAARPDCALDSSSGLILCSSTSTNGFPELTMSIQGAAFTLTGADYYDPSLQVVGIMAIDVGTSGSFWILGDTFLKHYYAVFNMENSSIGFTGAKQGLAYTAPSSSSDDSPWSRASWQLIVVIVVGVLLLLIICMSCIRCCTSGSRDPQRARFAQQQQPGPYILQQAPPFHSQPHRMQPQRQSEFARDFYRQA